MDHKNLQLPANCTVLNQEEMCCVDGGGLVSGIFYALGRMFRSTSYSSWESEIKQLEEAHGAVISVNNGVYTYSDGFTITLSHGSSFSTNIGDFFSGIGQFFALFGL